MSAFYQTGTEKSTNPHLYEETVSARLPSFFKQLKEIYTASFFFHAGFIGTGLALLLCLSFLIWLQPNTWWIALCLCAFFMTSFSYFILYYYFQSKKPQQLRTLFKNYVYMCQTQLDTQLPISDYYLLLAKGTFKFSSFLFQNQMLLFPVVKNPHVQSLISRFAYLMHISELIKMQEILIEKAIQNHIALIQEAPSNISAHTSLASTYIALSKLYELPTDYAFVRGCLITKRFFKSSSIQSRFQVATNEAIEELKIVDDLAPNDAWVHAKLATCYRLLRLKEKELGEYEALTHLRPDDVEVLERLGGLYFELGKKSKGLQVYDRLMQLDAKTAKTLLSQYDVYRSRSFSQFG